MEGHRTGDLEAGALGGVVWLSGGRAIQGVVKFVVLAVLARLLMPEEFGLVAAGLAVVWFMSIFSKLGVGPALVQREVLEDLHVRVAVLSALVLGPLSGLLIFVAAPYVASFFNMPDLVPVLRVLAILFPIQSLGAVGERLVQRSMRFEGLAKLEVLSHAVGYGVIGIGLALSGAGVWSLVGAEVVKESLKAAMVLRVAPYPLFPRYDGAALRDLLRFGAGRSLADFSMYFALQGDQLVIARFLGAAPLGLYGRAYELMVVPAKTLGSLVDQVLFPTMAKVQSEHGRLSRAFRRGLAVVAAAVLPTSAATAVLAPEIVATLLGEGWEGAVLPLRILALAMYARVGYMLGEAVAYASGAVYRAAWRNALYALLVVAGSLIGQRWGISGVAVAVVGAVTANFVLMTVLAARVSRAGFGGLLRAHVPAIAIAGLIGAEAWLINQSLQGFGVPAAARLGIAALALGLTFLAALRLARRSDRHGDLAWFFAVLARKSPPRLRPLAGRLLGTPEPVVRHGLSIGVGPEGEGEGRAEA